jgi:regulatory protein
MEKEKKYHTPKEALLKIRDWCAYQERCQQEVRDKLYEYGLKTDDVENIIVQLISENFVNEERFAIAFAGGKFRIKKWGKVKIRQELKAKRVSDYCIKKGMEQIEDTEYIKTLKRLLMLKTKLITEKNHLKKKQKLVRYALGKGYEQDIVFDILKSNEEEN